MRKAFGIGLMRERIVVKAPTITADSEGQPVKRWDPFISLWARIDFLSGSELQAMQKINSQISTSMTVRYKDSLDVKPTMQIFWRETMWNINAILPDEFKEFTELMVSKVE